MTILRKGRSAFDFFLNLFAFLAILVIIFVLMSVCLAVFMRYFLGNPLGWVIQTSQYSLIFITFLSAAWVLKRDRHVSMDLLTNKLDPRKKAMLGMITSLFGAIVCLIITYYGTLVTLDHFERHIHDMQVLEVPMGPIFAGITLGTFMLFIQFLRQSYGYLEQWRASGGEKAG